MQPICVDTGVSMKGMFVIGVVVGAKQLDVDTDN